MEQKSAAQISSEWIKNSVAVKLLIIGFLIIILLIPASMIQSLIREREERKNSVIEEISYKWGQRQTIGGPVLTIPYLKIHIDSEGKEYVSTVYAHFLPNELNLDGVIYPEVRYRGIYEAILYNIKLEIDGYFSFPEFRKLGISEKDIVWEDTFVSFGVSDMRGIKDNIIVKWNENEFILEPGIETNDIFVSGTSVKVPIENEKRKKDTYTFSLKININGSEDVNFIPLGKTTNVQLKSDWNNPSFMGAFLPQREITPEGFNATWKVLNLNRNYPQQWIGDRHKITHSAFGMKLLTPVDEHQKSMRTAKYAVLFIVLTFSIFFVIEILNKKRIHPIQYLLVGFAVCLFYVLLLSVSEQTGFGVAYLIASASTVILITAYTKSVLHNLLLTWIMGGILSVLYLFLYSILQLQDYALLMGSIGLLIVLALIMYFTRKIDWYAISLGNGDKQSEGESHVHP